MDSFEKRRGLKGVFASKEDRQLLFLYRYYLGHSPLGPEYIGKLLDMKTELVRRKLHLFEQMGLVVRASADESKYEFVPLADKEVRDILEEFYSNRSSDYQEMARALSAAEISVFLGAQDGNGGADVVA
jgi:hypothetical protein